MAWYELNLQPDGNSWLVTSPAFEELVTYGEDKEAACRNGREAILQAIAGRIADNEEIPVPVQEPPEEAARSGFVQLPALALLKAALYMNLRLQGKTRADLMRALGWHREQVDRLFRLDHNSSLDQLEKAFLALGIPLQVSVPFSAAA
jgi:antitoxin HicB